MTRGELIQSLTLLKEQARNSGANTFVWDINIDNFNFVIDSAIKALEQEPTTKNDLGVDCISRKAVLELLEDTNNGWIINEVLQLPAVTPQEPRKGYLSIDDVMSVFDDFMCGEVDEDGTETFLEMLKDKAETEDS